MDIPEFMRADAGKYVNETKPEDIAWVGEEFLTGDADRERDEKFDTIKCTIFNRRYALRLILTEIIRYHPVNNQKQTDGVRLEQALTALLGSNGPSSIDKQAGGRKEVADDGLLRVVAREHLKDIYGFSDKPRTVTDLCYVAMTEVIPSFKTLGEQELEKIRRRLARKFAVGEARDRVMIEYTGQTDYDARRYIDLTNKILFYLMGLGLIGDVSPGQNFVR